ncbi:MAG: response regulator transcription factor, partial [Herminiimonas sp.]|nr:response regulator transcription factor [Herminiimonas sp.]
MHVLLVEDDHVLAQGIARTLRDVGIAVDLLGGGNEVMNLSSFAQFAVIVLDIGLPGIDGFEVLRRLRLRGIATPVLLLTARNAISDRVHGLEVGADDYLVKPFATAELIARIKALVRRSNPTPTEMIVGALVLDTFARRARIDDRYIDLSVREWAVLEYLMQQTGRVISKQQIINAILPWGGEMTDNAVEVYISRVRVKIADAGVTIRTIRGFGYLFEHIPA